MQIQHVDIFVSSQAAPETGDYAAPVGGAVEHLVPVIGSSGIWDAWVVPMGNLADLASLSEVTVTPVTDDNRQVLLRVGASEAEKRVGLRVYVLSQ